MEQQGTLEQKDLNSPVKKRPLAITIICILGFVGVAASIPALFSNVGRVLGWWYTPYLAISSVLILISLIGMWKMKKWGAYLYAGLFILGQIILISMGTWSFISFFISGIVVAIALYHLNKMD